MKPFIVLSIIICLLTGCRSKTTSETTVVVTANAPSDTTGTCEVDEVYQNLITAIRSRDTEAFDKNIGKIANIDSLIPFADTNSYTLLGYACKHKNLSAVAKLLERKADIENAYCDEIYQYDALSVAIDVDDLELVDFLISKGADVNRVYTEDAATPLFGACRRGNVAIASKLIEKGANVDGAGDHGGDYILYPLFAAIESGKVDLVQLLVKHGVNMNITDKQGETPHTVLKWAVKDEDIRKQMAALLFPSSKPEDTELEE